MDKEASSKYLAPLHIGVGGSLRHSALGGLVLVQLGSGQAKVPSLGLKELLVNSKAELGAFLWARRRDTCIYHHGDTTLLPQAGVQKRVGQ